MRPMRPRHGLYVAVTTDARLIVIRCALNSCINSA